MQTSKRFKCLVFLLLFSSQGQPLARPSAYDYLISSLDRGTFGTYGARLVDQEVDDSHLHLPHSYREHSWNGQRIANDHSYFPHCGNARHHLVRKVPLFAAGARWAQFTLYLKDGLPPVANDAPQFRIALKKNDAHEKLSDHVSFNDGSNLFTNRIVRTAYLYSTSALTDASIVRRIPASQFANAAVQIGTKRQSFVESHVRERLTHQ